MSGPRRERKRAAPTFTEAFLSCGGGVASCDPPNPHRDVALSYGLGPHARPVWQVMRDAVPPMIDSIWRANAEGFRPDANAVPDAGTEAVLSKLEELFPRDDGQRARRERALQVGLDLAQIQLVLFSQPANAISTPFITVLVLWLTSSSAPSASPRPPNALIVVVLLVSALSAASAIFLILDLDRPFGGLLQIPSAPLRNALPSLATLAP